MKRISGRTFLAVPSRSRAGILPAALILLIFLSPASSFPETWRFAVLCDTRGDVGSSRGAQNGVRTAVLGPMAKSILSDGAELVIFPGDLATGSALDGRLKNQWETWRKTLAPLYEAGVAVYPVRGNHETGRSGGIGDWRSVFPDLPQNGPSGEEGMTYSFDHKNARFIGFDNYIGKQSGSRRLMNPWVIEQVRGSKSAWVFVFSHVSLFTVNHRDNLSQEPDSRDALVDELAPRRSAYFCGHDHLYLRYEVEDQQGNPFQAVISGSGGAPFHFKGRIDKNSYHGRKVVLRELFFNGAYHRGKNYNSDGHPPLAGYLLVTVSGKRARGEWKALMNYSVKEGKIEGVPEFKTLDQFPIAERAR